MKKINIDKYLIKIVSKERYNDLNNELDELRKEKRRLVRLSNSLTERCQELEKLLKIKTNEYNRLVKELDRKINQLKQSSNKIDEQRDKIRRLNGAAGGYTKEINKLKDKIATQKLAEKVLREEFKALEEKNHNQALKIKELLSGQVHTTEEYKNNGLPHSTKKALSNRKRRD